MKQTIVLTPEEAQNTVIAIRSAQGMTFSFTAAEGAGALNKRHFSLEDCLLIHWAHANSANLKALAVSMGVSERSIQRILKDPHYNQDDLPPEALTLTWEKATHPSAEIVLFAKTSTDLFFVTELEASDDDERKLISFIRQHGEEAPNLLPW